MTKINNTHITSIISQKEDDITITVTFPTGYSCFLHTEPEWTNEDFCAAFEKKKENVKLLNENFAKDRKKRIAAFRKLAKEMEKNIK